MNPVDLARQRWRAFRKAAEKREQLELELTEAGERLAALQGDLARAEQSDNEAYAAAIADGKDEPPREVEQVEARIAAEQRRVNACVIAVENANAKLDALRVENATAWRKDTLAKIATAHEAYAASIREVERCREALADEVALHGWISDGIGVSPIRDALSGRVAPVDGHDPLSFARVLRELNEDAGQIATYLRDLEGPPTAWALMKRVEALVGEGTTREEALKQVGWDRGE